ncbi:hypothetical protein TNCV_2318711 [Trichonephila clavipes]|nr:hypothetical protein TNCV_2318711 [Trichonephila clavipes]
MTSLLSLSPTSLVKETRSLQLFSTSAAQQCFSVNAWTCILGDYPIEPYLLNTPLDGKAYQIFSQQVLLELLDVSHVPPLLGRTT